jgi:nucleoside-diphosphate-sugar epimerase
MGEVSSNDVQDCDAVVHLAAVGVSPQKASWEELFRVNVLESIQLWIAAADAGVVRFVICGSCFEYGRSGDRYEFIPTGAKLEPTSGYGASKAAATEAAIALAIERKLEAIILRPFQTFGEGQHESNFWPSLRTAALSGADFPMTEGSQVRDFLSVKGVATSFLDAAIRAGETRGEPRIVNVGSGQAQTLRDFAEFWWSQWNASGRLLFGAKPYRDGEVMRYVPLVND